MKLFLKLLLSMRLSVINSNSEAQDLLTDGFQSTKIVKLTDLDLYHKIGFEYSKNISKYVSNNWEKILKDGLSEIDDRFDFSIHSNFSFVNYENFKLTVSFKEIDEFSNKLEPVQKSFDLYLYNYDNMDKVVNEVENSLTLPSFVKNYNKKQLYYYLEANIKNVFDDICQRNIILNDEQEFFDYVSIKDIKKDRILFEFLNNTQFSIKIALS